MQPSVLNFLSYSTVYGILFKFLRIYLALRSDLMLNLPPSQNSNPFAAVASTAA